ncbi:type IV toxin-antitoxin system AbiEi family antitoxin domain-containing protein, partial [Deferribacter abyssi]|uniref:type IV toxin-antitoxin system AbiEi family antitoxin domain-containing protein n=1 Tax=Deferribacter abyssi TaxID=213806 RepID=UPI003C20F1DF
SKLSDKAIHQALYRAKKGGRIAQIRQEFYVIIPPEFYDRKMIPPYLFIDDMMKFLNKTYYVSMFSAASMLGAGHQQPMLFQLIIEPPALRNIKKEYLAIHFFIKKQIDINYIFKKKTKTGYINVSSVELTILDLILYHHRIGGIG